LKPTTGRLTMHGHLMPLEGQEAVIAQPGPMARTVEDLALAMKILAAPGQEDADPSIPPVRWRDHAEVSLRGLRVAFYADNGFFAPSPAFRRAVREAATALQSCGVEVEEWTPPSVADAWRIYVGLLLADGGAGMRRALGKSKRDWRVDRFLKMLRLPRSLGGVLADILRLAGQKRSAEGIVEAGAISTDKYWQLVDQRTRYRAAFQASMDADRFDAILCPPDALPALPHGGSFYLTSALAHPALYNLLGMPAGVVPATRVRAGEESDRPDSRDIVEKTARSAEAGSAGLPIGVQVAARHWREDVALAVMAALEEHFRAQPDYPAHPPI
jgi:fatty acid amide hydrolase